MIYSATNLHNGPIYSLDYSPDNSMLASGSMDKTTKILKFKSSSGQVEDLSNGAGIEVDTEIFLGAHKGMVRSVKFGRNSRKLLTSG